MGQSDMKRLVAYTSISHFGFIALGIFAFTTEAATGAVLYMVNHGIATGLLFLVVGMLIARGGSRQIGDYGGVAAKAPMLAGVFLLAGLASLALPGTNSFVSEFLVLIGSFPTRPVFTIVATGRDHPGRALHPADVPAHDARPGPRGAPRRRRTPTSAAGRRWARRDDGDPDRAAAALRVLDLDRRELAVVAPLVALILVLGFYPQPLLDLIEPAVAATMSDLGGSD